MPLQRELSTRAAVGTIGDCPTMWKQLLGCTGCLPGDYSVGQLRALLLAFVKPKASLMMPLRPQRLRQIDLPAFH
jgi:hypothetical protein